MGVISLTISLAAALARPGPAKTTRNASRWALAVYGGDLSTDPVIDAGEDFRIRIVALVESIGALWLGTFVLGITAAIAAVGAAARAFRDRREMRHLTDDSRKRVDQ